MSNCQVASRLFNPVKKKFFAVLVAPALALILFGSLLVFVQFVQADENNNHLGQQITKPLAYRSSIVAPKQTYEALLSDSLSTGKSMMLQFSNGIGISGTLERISVNSTSIEGNSDSYHTVMSGNGRYVVFKSEASNLVPGDTNGLQDVFVHDKLTGQIRRLEANYGGTDPYTENDGKFAISRDGKVIAFMRVLSEQADVLVIYRNYNQSNESVETPIAADIGHLSISADGRYIAFSSFASDLVPNDTNNFSDIFVYDSQTEDITRISTGLNGQESNDSSFNTSISDDGQFIAFSSAASNLIPNDTNYSQDVFLYSQQAGTIERISVGVNGGQFTGQSTSPSISSDGTAVAFDMFYISFNNQYRSLFVWRQGEETEWILTTIWPDPENNLSFRPVLSGDGRFIVFQSNDPTLISGDNNGYKDIYLHDRETGQTRLISTSEDGVQGNAHSTGKPAISSDGSVVAYSSAASNLVTGDTNNARDVFLLDRSGFLPIYPGQDWNVECPFCSVANSQQFVNGVNPRTGNFVHSDSFLSMPIAGGSLAFSYGYISEARDMYTTTMGYGWAHSYEMSLHFDSTALTHTVVMQAPGGSRFPYYGNGDGTYARYAGVTANLIRTDGTNPEDTIYEVTTYNQFKARFDYQGRLFEREDPNGNVITFTYADFNGTERLYQASQGNRTLTFDYYTANGRLHTVTDNGSRTVTLTYQGDDLHTVTGPTDATYEYENGDNLLTEVVDGAGDTVKLIYYDSEDRAYRVEDGEGHILVDIDFGGGALLLPTTDLSATSIVTASGTVMTFTYGTRGTLVDVTFACQDNTAGCQSNVGVGYDYNFKQDGVQDANGNPTTLRWDAGGSNLEYQRDALEHETFMTYDSFNNLTQTIDARQHPTTYTYKYNDPNDPNWPYLPTFRSSVTDTLGHTTLYTPTVADETGPIDGLLYEERDANGKVTRYGYNVYGQITQTVYAVGTLDAITTTYGFDQIGRLITTTQASLLESLKTVNHYNENGQLMATIANWNDLPDWTDCSFAAGPREENICTLYRYDTAGRQISTTNALGQVNVTFYNDAGRRYLGVTNYNYPADPLTLADPVGMLCDFASPHPEYNHCSVTEFDTYGRVMTTTDNIGRKTVTLYDPLGRTAVTIVNSVDVTALGECIFPPLLPDRDLCTLYQYDNMGNTIVVTDTVGRMQYTEYDALNRVKGTIENWDGLTEQVDCATLPRERDENICTQYQYDEVGNTILVTNTLTQTTRTFYDELNRVQASVENWQPGFNDPEVQCHLAPNNTDDENICTLYGYDDAGNQITTTNALSQTTLTVYDQANRPFLTVANWDSTPIDEAADCQFPPIQSDVNLCTVTTYDVLGRRQSTQDPNGYLTTFTYDGLGRVVTTTQYLDGSPVTSHTTYDALGNRLHTTNAEEHTTSYTYDSLNRLVQTTTSEGVTSTQAYNAAGWVLTTTNGLGYQTISQYDLSGRRISSTNPLSRTTVYIYDALGNQVQLIDAEGVTTTYSYDGLNRLVTVTENDVPGDNPTPETDVLTQYEYDALGNRLVITNALDLTSSVTLYDDLNRPIIVWDALGNDTHTAYNALGSRVVVTDANGAVTQYSYDGLNRMASANYLDDGETVSYDYDAVGNRLVMTDSVGMTSYVYDDLYRLITVTNPYTAVVGYRYDKVGNRTGLVYPDGKVVTYTYNTDNRLIQVEDWEGGLTHYGYDGAGRLITTTLPNDVGTYYTYDAANRLIELVHMALADGRLLARYTYEFDRMGNRTAVTETMRLPTSGGEQASLPTSVVSANEAPLTAAEAVAAIQPADIELAKDHLSRPPMQGPPPPPTPPIPPQTHNVLTTTQPLPLVAEAQPPFDTAEVLERARNQVQTGPGDLAYLYRPTHAAHFANDGGLVFAPVLTDTQPVSLTLDLAVPLTLSLQLAAFSQGTHNLPITAAPGQRTISENLVSQPRGPWLVEEFIARDRGIEQRWQLPAAPPHSGSLTLALEATTALSLTVDGEGFAFHAPTTEGLMIPVMRYGRALAIDANGVQKWAELSFSQLQPAPDGRARYRLQMTIPADWLATAQYPLLIDPLLNNLIRLEQASPANNQQIVEAAYNPDADEFLLVWQDYRNGNWDIYAQRANSDGALLDENFIITNAAYEQSNPRIAYGGGVYLVAWKRHGSSSSTAFDVYGAIISGTGTILYNNLAIAADTGTYDREAPSDIVYNSTADQFLVLYRTLGGGWANVWSRVVAPDSTMGSKTQITSQASNHEESAVGAYNPNMDSFLIAWESFGASSPRKLYGQRLTNGGTPTGSVIDIGDGSGDERQSDMLYLPEADQYLILWRDNRNSGSSSYDIYGQRINPDGSLDGSNFVVSDETVEESLPRLAENSATGGALAVWQQNSGGSAGYDLYAHQVDNNGQLTGSRFAVEVVNADQNRPVLAQNSAGAYLVAWYDQRHGNADIFTRMRLADGSWGSTGMAHPAPGDQEKVQIAYNPDDDEYLVVWQDYRSSTDWNVYGQRVDGDGSLLGQNIAIDTTTTKHQILPQVAYGDGEYLVAWQHYTDSSNTTYDVYGRVVNADGTFVTRAFVIADALDASSKPMKESPSDIAYNSSSDQFLVLWKAEYSANNWNIWGRHVTPTGSTGTYIQIATTVDIELDAIAAYNPDNDQYLAVWEAVNSFGYSTVTGRRLTGSGTVTTTDSIAISTNQATNAAADITYQAGTHQYLVLWQQMGDIYSRGVLPDGTLAGSPTAVANTAQSETHPRLAANTQGILAVWQRQNTGSGYDLYARTLDGNGLPNGDSFVIQETAGNQQNVAVAAGSNLRTQLAWQDDREGGWDLFTASLDRSYQVTHIQYEYDPLYRLVHADYDGDFNGEYRYAYDAAGNRTTYTTTITSTTVITYLYDAANRLLESVEVGGDTTTYDWDVAGRLITTTVGLNVSRVYTYSQDGDLTAALVDSLLTTFVYDGQGHRLQISVAGEVTTYTLDYAGGFRVLLEQGGAFAESKHYLYGLACIGELVDADEPESEWRYYHQDGNHLVRQTTNVQATVTLAWTYSPEGAVVLGEEGPVTYLGCEGSTTYDFSTGLIFKNGNYFDPNTGIWITLGGLVVWNGWQSDVNNRKRKRQRGRRLLLLLLLLLIIISLAGCGNSGNSPGGTPNPTATATCTPTSIPTPPISRKGNLPPSSVTMRFVLKNGSELAFKHRGTIVDSNAVLTSNHWLGSRDLNDIENWEILGGTAHNYLLISGKPEDLQSSGSDKFGGAFDLIVFNPMLGNLQNKAELGNASLLRIGDTLQQAVIQGADDIGQAPGLFEVTVSSTDYRSIRVIGDIATVGDSGLGLFDDNGVVYGANWGSSQVNEGLYGAVMDPSKVNSEISRLKGGFTP